MQVIKKISRHLPLILATSLLTACGGGGGGGNDDEEPSAKTGVFLDSAVGGVSYRTSTQSGTTNSAGEFQYEDDEIVSFSIGKLLLGSFLGRNSITPVELANAFRSDDELSVNIARLLQTLDVDQNPDNGIELIAAATNLADTIDLNDASSIQSGLDSLSAGLTLVSADDALAHLNATLNSLPAPQLAASYSYVTARYGPTTSCTPVSWSGATLDVSGSGDTTTYSGTVTKGSSIENFNLDNTGRGVTDAGSSINIGADEYAAEISVNPTTGDCSGQIHLTTNDAVNLPPIAGRNSKFTIEICNSANGFYDFGFDGYAGDRDGYIAKHPTFKYTVDGEPTVELVVGANGLVASGYGAKAAVRVDRAEILDTRCTKGFTWEYIVEDNEGKISIATGSMEAPFEDDGSGSGTGDFCADDYPKDACDLIDGATFSADAACSSVSPSATELGDFACTGDSIFTSCGACVIDSTMGNLRNVSKVSEHASDTLYRALGQQ